MASCSFGPSAARTVLPSWTSQPETTTVNDPGATDGSATTWYVTPGSSDGPPIQRDAHLPVDHRLQVLERIDHLLLLVSEAISPLLHAAGIADQAHLARHPRNEGYMPAGPKPVSGTLL